VSARKRRVWPWVLGLGVVAAGAVAVSHRSASDEKPIDAALIVTAQRRNLVLEVVETGKVVARKKVELKSKVAGQVAQVLVEQGAQVKKGDLLLTLDPRDFAREVARAGAELAQAKADVAYAKLVMDRAVAGAAESVTTTSDVEKAKHEHTAKGIAVRLAQIALAAAEERLRYTKIVSPMDGTVIARNIQPGEMISPGVESTFDNRSLLTVADLQTLIVEVALNQIDVVHVREGQLATLMLDALPGKTSEAKITKIAPASVRLPGRELDVFPIEAEIAVVDGLIKPGMTADVRIRMEEKVGILSLPVEAVVQKNGKWFVMRVIDRPGGKQSTENVEVAIGTRNERAVELVSGIEEGHRVLLAPATGANGARM